MKSPVVEEEHDTQVITKSFSGIDLNENRQLLRGLIRRKFKSIIESDINEKQEQIFLKSRKNRSTSDSLLTKNISWIKQIFK